MSVNRTLELRKFITSKLETVHNDIYFEHAPKDANYPFLVYSFDQSTDDGLIEIFPLVIDGWDNKSDTTELEILMSKVDNLLHRLNGGDDKLFFIFYRTNRRPIADSDRQLRRRQIEFEVKVMGGNR